VIVETDFSEQTDEHFSYLTFYNYFKAIELAFQVYEIGSVENLVAQIKKQNKGITRKNKIEDDDAQRLRQSLFHSWNSQIHLHQYVGMDDDYIAISLQWLPTIFYYTLYHSTQAYFAASGKPHTPNHTEALRVLATEHKRFPLFMGATCSKFLPTPQFSELDLGGQALNELSNLATPNKDNVNLHLAKILKTTRNQALTDGYEEKRKRLKRKNLTKDHKIEVDTKLNETGLVQFLYRMRKRFNYEDGEIAHQGGSSSISANSMYKAIRRSYMGYSFTLEWLAANYAGKNNFNQIFEEFKGRVKNPLANEAIETLENRFKLYF
jgi:hypothetical protein